MTHEQNQYDQASNRAQDHANRDTPVETPAAAGAPRSRQRTQQNR